MASVNILDFELNCSLGNLKQSINAIKNAKIYLSKREFKIANEYYSIPFYSLKDNIKQKQDDIYEAIKEVISKIISKIDIDKRSNTALLIGTSLVDWHLVDAINNCAYEYKKTPYNSQKFSIDSYAKELSLEFGLHEFTMSINTACTSSANALLEARNLINANVAEQVIVVGLEIFSTIMSSGFYTMDLLSKTSIKSFDKNRDGLILGEGVGAILLGKSNSSWSLKGGFSNCNSQTITSVSPSGEECVEVMQNALRDCTLHVEDITAIKAHATGSRSNDESELNAMAKVFDNSVIFTALKPYIGHTIGASGVLEIALFMSAIDDGFIPKTLTCKNSLLEGFEPLSEHKKCTSGIFMCNYFGFGGNNISLIIQKKLP